MSINQAERSFYESIDYGKQMSKCMAKPKCRGIGKGVDITTPKEVLEKLSSLGISISERTLQRYAKQGLIPKPETKSAGRGKGKITDYPEDTTAEAYATFRMMHGAIKISPNSLAQARQYALAANPTKIEQLVEEYTSSNLEGKLWAEWLNYKAQGMKKHNTLVYDVVSISRKLSSINDKNPETRLEALTDSLPTLEPEELAEYQYALKWFINKTGTMTEDQLKDTKEQQIMFYLLSRKISYESHTYTKELREKIFTAMGELSKEINKIIEENN